jgi:hypothetical protein
VDTARAAGAVALILLALLAMVFLHTQSLMCVGLEIVFLPTLPSVFFFFFCLLIELDVVESVFQICLFFLVGMFDWVVCGEA